MTPLKLQSPFGDKPLRIQVVCTQNGTAVLKELYPLQIPTTAFGGKLLGISVGSLLSQTKKL